MINPKELRVGNLVHWNNLPKEVHSNGNILVNFKTEGEGIERCIFTHGEIFPIPLTHEILEKAGFVYDETNEEYTIGGIDFDANDQDIEKTFILWSDNKEDFECYFSDIPIKSVHQLQNLFYALTGEELEIKL